MGRGDRDDGAPHFATQDERDRWQIQQYGAVRNGFRTELDRTDERPLLVWTSPEWEYIPAVHARRAAIVAGKKHWTCPGCDYRHPIDRPTCDGCNRSEEERYTKAQRACPVSQSGSMDMFQYLREVASLANGMPARGVRTMPAAETEP